jgi:fluoroquinolone resistance protein
MDSGYQDAEYLDQTFQGLQISGSEVRGCTFSDCVFSRCNLSDIDFENCSFHNCDFRSCDLSLSRVNNCSFIACSFKDSKLVGINWTDAYWPKGRLLPTLSFESCLLNHSVFMGLALPKLHIVKCTARGVDFTEVDLIEADCRFTDFANSRFSNTNLSQANFTGATNYTIAAGSNKIKGAKFSLPEAMSLLYNLDIVLSEEGADPQ